MTKSIDTTATAKICLGFYRDKTIEKFRPMIKSCLRRSLTTMRSHHSLAEKRKDAVLEKMNVVIENALNPEITDMHWVHVEIPYVLNSRQHKLLCSLLETAIESVIDTHAHMEFLKWKEEQNN